MPGFLLIQTASIGDVILTTPVIEKLHHLFPEQPVEILVKKGCESLFDGHPYVSQVLVWDKSHQKFANLFRILRTIRSKKYDKVYNFQRFASSGFITCFSGASETAGFDKNPFSFCFDEKFKHTIYPESEMHEVQRNLSITGGNPATNADFRPRLYPAAADLEKTASLKKGRYVCIAPASLWFTKQYPKEKWIELINQLDEKLTVYLTGGKSDYMLCESIISESRHTNIINLAGKLTLLQSAALMKDAEMNWVNDSSPMHLASSVDAPVAAVFCSTIPGFGFGPLSSRSHIIETQEKLSCRPCGLHGHQACPEKHFDCAYSIKTSQLLNITGHD